MTRDEFADRYKLLHALATSDGSTYAAEYRDGGQPVLVHFLSPDADAGRAVLDLIEGLPPAERTAIIETPMVETSTVVVSKPIELHGSFEQWLRSRREPSDSVSASAVVPAPPPAPSAGEFTQLFRAGDEVPSAGAAAPPPTAAPAAPLSGSGPAIPSDSFTAVFQPQAPPAAPRAEPLSPTATAPAIPIREVRVPTAVASPPPATAPSSHPPPVPDEAVVPAVPLMRSPDLAPPRFQQGATQPHAPASPVVPRPHQGFVLPTMVPPPSASAQPGAQPAPVSSDYTRILKGARESAPPEPPPALPVPAPPASAEVKSYLPLLILLNVVLIVGTALVVYFALKHR
jgi:hypothetical protein